VIQVKCCQSVQRIRLSISVHAFVLPAGPMQRSTSWNMWYSDKTVPISAECCGSFTVGTRELYTPWSHLYSLPDTAASHCKTTILASPC